MHASLQTTVGEFKLRLQQETRIPVERQRLIFRGRALLDDQRLVDQRMQLDQALMHLILTPVGISSVQWLSQLAAWSACS